MKNVNWASYLMRTMAGLVLALAVQPMAHGALVFSDLGGGNYRSSASPSQALPDGTGVGFAYSMSFGFSGLTISAVTVTFTTSGSPAYNGDLYAYLAHGANTVVLLNRVGVGSGGDPTYGFSTSGFDNITLDSSSGNGSIHDVQNPSSGTSYTPDGGNLASFNTSDPNGSWTLYFQDMSGGSINTLDSFHVDITAVPEPTTWAGIIFGVLFCGMQLARKVRARLMRQP